MEVKLFYRTQRDVASAINQLIDAYWKEEIMEQKLIESISVIHKNNQEKLIKDNNFTKIIQQHCGKRRLVIVGKILGM
ncbi:TIGR04540 family protein [Planococcus sp. CP5-4]|uniref:TIGR04540 family protein n=1 Tax=unclassified Planococcus (in: firmicutes) TaxID=2662419 RepID=UPI001C23B2BF|nr:TIGR04540 family protein [Planococcus sp. CP5-4]MBU9674000.1 TIGR04540 family protein [Planococcus sp. CP5-4_YE]MBV0909871.1 TIGR04540 family protein [Planococcus sp. CP5-4_UN]MBW6064751.1 TIGR04540 family protein [Planococcus sp. CP5-4]